MPSKEKGLSMSSKESVFNLSAILEQAGFDAKARRRIKLIRHPISNKTVKAIYDKGYIEIYQCEQYPETFRNCDYVFSFIGEGGSSARFLGCYKVGASRPASEMRSKIPDDYPDKPSFQDDSKSVYFDLQKTDILESLQNRLVIRWNNPISWHQWATNDMPVITISPRIQFPGYESVSVTFQELKEIIEEQTADWFNPLSKVGGVYLITTPEGLYVGSAYGKEGLWKRWSDYVQSKHGGNKELIELIEKNPGIYHEFRYSILKVVPKRSIDEDVIAWENYFKEVLQTRNSPWGLNSN